MNTKDTTIMQKQTNTYGETLLAEAFPSKPGERGLYTHFDNDPTWKLIEPSAALYDRADQALDLEKRIVDGKIVYGEVMGIYGFYERNITAYTNDVSVVANFWDGDGTTVCGNIASENWVINTDTKCDYTWSPIISHVNEPILEEENENSR